MAINEINTPKGLNGEKDINDYRNNPEVLRGLLDQVKDETNEEATSGEHKPFQFVLMDDLARERKPVDWLVKGFVEAGTHSLTYGDPECGKSLVAMDIGYHVAAGRPWHGNKTKQGAVFYICGEGRGGISRRAAAWRMQNKIKPEERFPFYCSELPAKLIEEDSTIAVAQAVEGLTKATGETPVLVIVDTLARNFGGGNENSAEDMGVVIGNVDAHLISRLGAAIITVHHTGHADKERPRGSASLTGAVDTQYRITRDEDDAIRVECTKAKDHERPQPKQFKLAVHDLGYTDEDGDPVTGATVAIDGFTKPPKPLSGEKGRVMGVLRSEWAAACARLKAKDQVPDPLITVDYWRDAAIDHKLKSEGLDRDIVDEKRFHSVRTAVTRTVRNLLNDGLVIRRNDGIHVMPADWVV